MLDSHMRFFVSRHSAIQIAPFFPLWSRVEKPFHERRAPTNSVESHVARHIVSVARHGDAVGDVACVTSDMSGDNWRFFKF